MNVVLDTPHTEDGTSHIVADTAKDAVRFLLVSRLLQERPAFVG
jgi:hypothetical protein